MFTSTVFSKSIVNISKGRKREREKEKEKRTRTPSQVYMNTLCNVQPVDFVVLPKINVVLPKIQTVLMLIHNSICLYSLKKKSFYYRIKQQFYVLLLIRRVYVDSILS